MRQKLRLLRADGYSFTLSSLHAVEMLGDFLAGRPHVRWIGNEQGGIPILDDIVVENYDRSLKHIQVKRQQGDFDTHSAKRSFLKSTKATAKAIPTLVPLSTLDETVMALADRFQSMTYPAGPRRSFNIAVPSLQVLVKKGIALKHFQELCIDCNNPQATAAGLQQRAQKEPLTANIFDWLTTWCAFIDWEHILRALKHVEVTEHGLEAQLQLRATQELERWFKNPDEVLDSIRIYLEDKATDLGGTTPRLLLSRLHSRLRSDARIWTQYSVNPESSAWSIAGTASDTHDVIDAPDKTVPVYWHSDSNRDKKLHIAVTYPQGGLRNSPLAGSLIRLAVHLKAPGHVSFNKCDVWTRGASESLANTLGLGPTDLDAGNLQWIDQMDILSPCDTRSISSNADLRRETDQLSSQMTRRVCQELKGRVADAIAHMQPGDLQEEIEQQWNDLSSEFDADEGYCSNFLASMLSPASEGLGNLAAIRVGPKTVPLLTDGILMLLAVKIALAPDYDLASYPASHIKTICLRYWGGPVHSTRKARQLIDDDNDADIEDLMGKEVAQIILMPAVSAPTTEINRIRLADDSTLADCFAAPRRPLLTIARTRSFRQTIETGSIEKLREFLRPELDGRLELRAENIKNASNEN